MGKNLGGGPGRAGRLRGGDAVSRSAARGGVGARTCGLGREATPGPGLATRSSGLVSWGGETPGEDRGGGRQAPRRGSGCGRPLGPGAERGQGRPAGWGTGRVPRVPAASPTPPAGLTLRRPVPAWLFWLFRAQLRLGFIPVPRARSKRGPDDGSGCLEPRRYTANPAPWSKSGFLSFPSFSVSSE